MTQHTEWLTVESLDLEAQGVARSEEGKVVFIEGALPGEQVQVSVGRKKKSWEQATMTAMRRESSQRVTPGCPHAGMHAGACGGCKMQHLHAGAQMAVKQRVVEDNLWHLGKVKPELLLRPIEGPAWGYRYRARFSVRYVQKKSQVLIGFHERKSRYVADMQVCKVVPARVSDLLMPLRALIAGMDERDHLPQIELAMGDEVIALVLRHMNPLLDADRARLRAFATEHDVQWWLQSKGPDTVGSETLVQRSRANAQLNGLATNTAFEARNLFEMTPTLLAANGSADKWLVDPPRDGAFALMQALVDIRLDASLAPGWTAPERIVYVSCNPATLARDAGLLVNQGGYRCTAASAVNMFPHTSHVESIAVFELP